MENLKSKIDTVSIEIPANLIENLKKESNRRRKTVEQIIAEVLEDREDFMLAEKCMKGINSGKTKLIPQKTIKKKLGL